MMRHPGKYGNHGYGYTQIEAGLALARIELAAAEVGIATLPFGGFRAQALVDELGMDKIFGSSPGRVRPLVTIALGYEGQQDAFDFRDLADRLEPLLVGRGRPIVNVGCRISSQGGAFVAASAPTRQVGNRRRVWVNSGKAGSAGLARVKALAEGLERYVSGVARVEREASAMQLTGLGLSWLDPDAIAPLADEQYAMLGGVQRFSRHDMMQWVQGRRAGSGEPVLVPVDLAYYPSPASRYGRKTVSLASSNGVAAYTDEAGAVGRALLELLERDALVRNWFHRDSPPRIPTELLPYHWQRRVEYWQAHNRQVHVLDLSEQAHGAVVIEVAIIADDGAQPAFMSGAGASVLSFEDALQKAFLEAEAFMETIIHRPFKRRVKPDRVRRVLQHAQLYAFPEQAATLSWLFDGEPAGAPPQPQTDIERLLATLDPVVVRLAPLREGIDTIVGTLSPADRSLIADSPLWVMRVLSEHLIPIHFGYGTGHYTHPTLNGRVAPDHRLRPQYFA
jgi:thiazole/oxazole-forming peptide maturase SagD family component